MEIGNFITKTITLNKKVLIKMENQQEFGYGGMKTNKREEKKNISEVK